MEKRLVKYSGYHALIADDHEVNLMVFSQVLNRRGIKTDVALNGAIAWEKLQVVIPDIIFVDLQMPVMNGMQLLRKIRSSEIGSLRNVPVIAVTGDQLFDFEKARSENELTSYLLKPYSSIQLDEILSCYLKDNKSTPPYVEANAKNKPLPGFERIIAITKGNIENYIAILRETERVLESDQVQFEIGLKNRDLELIKRMIHKNKTISDYYHAVQMMSIMESAIQILENPDSTIEDTLNVNQSIRNEIGKLLTLIRLELNNCKDTARK